jgi:leucyl aminopeptidase
MIFHLVSGEPTRAAADLLCVAVFESDLSGKPAGLLAPFRAGIRTVLLKAAAQESFKGKAEQTFMLHTHGRLKASRVVLLGLGSKERYRAETLRLAAGRAAKLAGRMRARSLTFALPPAGDRAEAVRAVAEGLELGAYRFDRYRSLSAEEKNGPRLEKASLVLPKGETRTPALSQALALGQRIAAATNWARDLVNEPAGTLTPSALA